MVLGEAQAVAIRTYEVLFDVLEFSRSIAWRKDRYSVTCEVLCCRRQTVTRSPLTVVGEHDRPWTFTVRGKHPDVLSCLMGHHSCRHFIACGVAGASCDEQYCHKD